MIPIQTLPILLLAAASFNLADSVSWRTPQNGRQWSPRLLYRRTSGDQPQITDPVAFARDLLEKLQMDRLYYDIMRAMVIPTEGLLFEMKTHQQASDVNRAWRRILRKNRQYGIEDSCPAEATLCVGTGFELRRTQRDFFVGPIIGSNNSGRPTYR